MATHPACMGRARHLIPSPIGLLRSIGIMQARTAGLVRRCTVLDLRAQEAELLNLTWEVMVISSAIKCQTWERAESRLTIQPADLTHIIQAGRYTASCYQVDL